MSVAPGPPTSSPVLSKVDEWKQDEDADRLSREVIKQRIINPGEYTDYEKKCFDIGLKMEEIVMLKKSEASNHLSIIKPMTSKTFMIQDTLIPIHNVGHVPTNTRVKIKEVKTKYSLLQASTIYKDHVLYG